MRVSAVIPARLASTRFPEKVLAELGGKSVLEHVWRATCRMRGADEVIIATDAEKIRSHAEGFGARVLMTSPDCPNGTARIASILPELQGDFILNVQGDEPFIQPTLLDQLVETASRTDCDMVTAVYPLVDAGQLSNPNLVKVVRADDGHALYFSRSAVPYLRDVPSKEWLDHTQFWGHVGIYGYSRSLLEAYGSLSPCRLETLEKLEQLRFLDHGYTIQTVETSHVAPGIDTPDDLAVARDYLEKNHA